MNIENLHPYTDDHAIQNAVIALEWEGDLSEKTLQSICALAPKLRDYFPTTFEVENENSVTIERSNKTNFKETIVSSVSGVSFQRQNSKGTIAKRLDISRQNCVFVIQDYVRWDAALTDAMKSLELILPIILDDRAVNTIGLQYTDLFNWKDDPELLDMAFVFRSDSPYIPRNVFSSKNLWHSYHGYIESADTPVQHDQLHNVNISVLDLSGERNIQIVVSHRATLAKPLRRGTLNYLNIISEVENSLHLLNKDIMISLLTEEVCKKIKLVHS